MFLDVLHVLYVDTAEIDGVHGVQLDIFVVDTNR